MVPLVVALLSMHPLVDKYDFSSVEHLVVGAAPCSPALADRCYERIRTKVGNMEKFSLSQAFGMTETSKLGFLLPQLDPELRGDC